MRHLNFNFPFEVNPLDGTFTVIYNSLALFPWHSFRAARLRHVVVDNIAFLSPQRNFRLTFFASHFPDDCVLLWIRETFPPSPRQTTRTVLAEEKIISDTISLCNLKNTLGRDNDSEAVKHWAERPTRNFPERCWVTSNINIHRVSS